MTLKVVLTLTPLLTAVLLWLLRRSEHPVARKLLTDVGSKWDYTGMGTVQLRASARRCLLFGLAECSVAGLLLAVHERFLRATGVQVATVGIAVILIVASFMSLLNAGHFALLAFSRRTDESDTGAPNGSSIKPRYVLTGRRTPRQSPHSSVSLAERVS